jgi:hypothetical protein
MLPCFSEISPEWTLPAPTAPAAPKPTLAVLA